MKRRSFLAAITATITAPLLALVVGARNGWTHKILAWSPSGSPDAISPLGLHDSKTATVSVWRCGGDVITISTVREEED